MEKQSDNLHVLLCTAQNTAGIKYKVKANVEQIFEKFVTEGRATIRFKDPPHNILISKADSIQLKSFLKIIRLTLNGKACDKLCFPRLAKVSASQVQAVKNKIEVQTRGAYLQLSSIPSTLISLILNNCELKKISERIPKLRNLKLLDLNFNCITEIPFDVGGLVLEELHVSNNKLEAISSRLFLGNMANTLHTLDLSNNNLSSVPSDICNLKGLVTLKLSNNKLTHLPPNLWLLNKLKHFSASENLLIHLPGTMTMLKLDFVNVSGNPFKMDVGPMGIDVATLHKEGVPTLVEWSSRTVLKSRLVFEEGDLPVCLTRYLSNSKRCVCGRLFVEASVRVRSLISLNTISACVVYSRNDHPSNLFPISTDLCNPNCIANIKKKIHV